MAELIMNKKIQAAIILLLLTLFSELFTALLLCIRLKELPEEVVLNTTTVLPPCTAFPIRDGQAIVCNCKDLILSDAKGSLNLDESQVRIHVSNYNKCLKDGPHSCANASSRTCRYRFEFSRSAYCFENQSLKFATIGPFLLTPKELHRIFALFDDPCTKA